MFLSSSAEVIRNVNKSHQEVLDYRRYKLVDKSSEHNWNAAKNFAKSSKRLLLQIPSHSFDVLMLTSVIRFLHAIKVACGTNEILESATM